MKAHTLEPRKLQQENPLQWTPQREQPPLAPTRKNLHGATKSPCPTTKTQCTKNNYFFKVQASWFPNCVPWGVLGQHNQLGRAGCFNKFLRETQKHSTWIRHKQTTSPKQSQCPLETSVHSLLMTLYLCKVDQIWLWLKTKTKTKNMPLLLKHHLQYCKRNRWWCPTWLPGKSWRAWQEHVRIPLEVTVLI